MALDDRVGLTVMLEVGLTLGVTDSAVLEDGVDVLVGRTVFIGRKLSEDVPLGVTLGVTLTLPVGDTLAVIDPDRVAAMLTLPVRLAVRLVEAD